MIQKSYRNFLQQQNQIYYKNYSVKLIEEHSPTSLLHIKPFNKKVYTKKVQKCGEKEKQNHTTN